MTDIGKMPSERLLRGMRGPRSRTQLCTRRIPGPNGLERPISDRCPSFIDRKMAEMPSLLQRLYPGRLAPVGVTYCDSRFWRSYLHPAKSICVFTKQLYAKPCVVEAEFRQGGFALAGNFPSTTAGPCCLLTFPFSHSFEKSFR